MADVFNEQKNVRLRSGDGTVMVIEEIFTEDDREFAVCVWLDKNGHGQRFKFQTTALELVRDRPQGSTPQPDSSWVS